VKRRSFTVFAINLVQAIGDVNGDGKADVILRNNVSGINIINLMDGTTRLSSVFIPTIGTTWNTAGR